MTPLVSILVAAYNAQAWIAATIRSALSQTWPRIEVIVVDDGSTDRTYEIARSFPSDKILVTSQPNQGAATARNNAYSLCHGDYVQWLDADDLLAPDKIARQMAVMLRCDAGRVLLSSAWGHFYLRPQKATFSPSDLWCNLPPTEWLIRKMAQHLTMTNMAWLVSRELTEAAGPWDPRLTLDDDGEYFCRVVMASSDVRFVREAVSFYRRSGPLSLSHAATSSRKLDSLFLSNRLHVRYLLSLEDSDRTRAACLRYLQYYMYDYRPQRPDLVQELENLATSLGGRVTLPSFSWKYAWLHKVCGWDTAKQSQMSWWAVKERLFRFSDRSLSSVSTAVKKATTRHRPVS